MSYIGIIIILLLVIIEIYFSYIVKPEEKFTQTQVPKEEKNTKESVIENEEIDFDEENPWCKVILGKENYTKYFIKIKNFDSKKFIDWKQLINKVDYDVDMKTLIVETDSEAEALAIVNLVISNMNSDIDMNEILEKNLLTISIRKAKAHKLVCNKLIELIKANNNESKEENDVEYTVDTVTMDNDIAIVDKVEMLNKVNKNIFENGPIENLNNVNHVIEPYGGNEYSLI